MKNLKVLLTMIIGTLFLLNTVDAKGLKFSPKEKFSMEVSMLLDRASHLDLNGKSIETTLVLQVDDDNRLVLVDSGTDNANLNEFLTQRLDQKRIWTRNVKQNVPYLLTVRFKPVK